MLRRSLLALAAFAGVVPLLGWSSPVSAAPAGPDLAVLAAHTGVRTVKPGQRLVIEVVAVNHGQGEADQAVTITTPDGLTAERARCAFGVSPDGPNTCEYGAPKVNRPFRTRFVLRAAAIAPGRKRATVQVCTTNLVNTTDPVPGNNCRSVKLRLVG